jgi:hypothetical protein
MNRQIESLDHLVSLGLLTSYEFVNVSANNIEGEISEHHNSDRLKLIFPNGLEVKITAITTGMEEDALLRLE